MKTMSSRELKEISIRISNKWSCDGTLAEALVSEGLIEIEDPMTVWEAFQMLKASVGVGGMGISTNVRVSISTEALDELERAMERE